MRSLVKPLCIAWLVTPLSYGEEPQPHRAKEPTAADIGARQAVLNAKLDEIEARLQLHSQLLAQRAKAARLKQVKVDD